MKKVVSKEKNKINSKPCSFSIGRNTIIVFASVILAAAILVTILILRKNNDPLETIYYYPASESQNIFENEAYLDFERNLRYSMGGVEALYEYEKDYGSGDEYCKFFLDYFKTIIEGDGEKLQGFYIDGFFKSQPDITMQMIYEPYVLFHSEGKLDENGKEIEVANFEVRYKIFKNNGSFRKGVGSNIAVPQIYQLTLQNGEIKIHSIFEIAVEDEN